MFIKKSQIPIFIFNIIYLLVAAIVFLSRKNYEFIMYVGVIIFFLALIVFTNKKVNYPNFVLWGLTLWGFLHMLGGGLLLNNGTMRLYELILIPLSNNYPIFKYDQFVHIVGFGVATLVMYVLLKPLLKTNLKKWTSVSIVVIMAGFGVGALNEMIEFLATVLVPETGVGGYVNTSLDLVADLIGAILAMIYIKIRKGEI
jgi:uncharacterized membrane protein YjdF